MFAPCVSLCLFTCLGYDLVVTNSSCLPSLSQPLKCCPEDHMWGATWPSAGNLGQRSAVQAVGARASRWQHLRDGSLPDANTMHNNQQPNWFKTTSVSLCVFCRQVMLRYVRRLARWCAQQKLLILWYDIHTYIMYFISYGISCYNCFEP